MEISDRLLNRFASAARVVFFTGAGISAESGVPTFRGNGGIWKKFKPEELATFEGFLKNPALVWEWYRLRKQVIAAVQPNAGHRAIADLERYYRVTVVTQNIDNLHRRAGSSTVYELHGNIERNFCCGCGTMVADDRLDFPEGAVPKCAKCSGMIRPDVVWFGEFLPEQEWNNSVEAARWADVFFCVGTSGIVYPAASLPGEAKKAGAYLVEVNVGPTDLTPRFDESLFGAAGHVLPAIADAVQSLSPNNIGMN
ncbi:MAG TPA: NAD-dependent deacylase [Bacteroidota bacterium]|nr:NAD-dependent deacylase [Bacteroidota bacterium]